MKDKKKENAQVVPLAQETPTAPQPMKVEMVERLSDQDKSVLDLAKAKRETALANAKAALAQNEAAELAYNNVILQLALRYHLSDGDVISDEGVIQRKENQQ